MTDDRADRDLDAELEAWAAATDPTADPITSDEARDPARAAVVAPPGGRRWLTAAAVLVLVAIAAAVAVALVRDDPGADEVATSGTDPVEDGARTQVVVDAPDIDPSWWTVAHRVVLRDPNGRDDVLARPLVPGTSLVVDQVLAPGRWHLLIQRFDCTDVATSCGAPSLDGTPAAAVEPTQCAVPLDVGTTGSRIVVGYGTGADGGLACGRPTDRGVDLTVPPAWTLRPELPWSCGAASHDINGMLSSSDPQAARATLGCFEDALDAGTPVEIPVAELQAGDGITRSWWRVLPEPVDGHRIEAIRDQGLEGTAGWARVRCDDIVVEHSNVDTTTPDGGIVGYDHVGARLTGCDAEEPLPLDVPLLDPPPPSTTTTTTTLPGGVVVDVVIDSTLVPRGPEPITWSWSLYLGDDETLGAEGPTAAAAATGAVLGDHGGPPVALVADDLPVPADAEWVGVEVDGPEELAQFCIAGLPPADGPDGSVLVVRIAPRDCTPDWTDTLPALTVPPTWSLRTPPEVTCVVPDGGTAEDAGRCLGEAQGGDRTAEWWTTDGEGRPLVWRVEGIRDIDLVHPGVDGGAWTIEQCSGVALLDLVPGPEADGCTPPEEMPLDL